MSKHAPATAVQPTPAVNGLAVSGDVLLRAFTEMRDDLVSTLLYLLGNAEDAQDAAQETFLKCWRTRASLDGVQNLRAWVFRVGLNTVKDMQKSAWKRKARALANEEEIMQPGSATPPSEGLEQEEELQRLRAALVALRNEEKEVFLLRQNGRMTYEEIAAARGVPVGTVKTQMRSALQKLRKVLT